MISKNQLKAISKILPKKAFNQIFQDLIYYKEFNTFVATDSHVLYEFKNTTDAFGFDFTINGGDLMKIKDDIDSISIDGEIATITTKKDIYIARITKNQNQPSYKRLFDNLKQNTISELYISNNYSRFFDVCSILELEKVEIKQTFFYGEKKEYNQNHTLLCRIQQKY